MLSEYLETTLEDMIPKNGQGMEESQVARITAQILKAIEYLHENEIEA